MIRSGNTHHQKDLLRVLRTARPSLRKAILSEADKALIFSICEICDNLLVGNIPLTPEQRKRLEKYKEHLRLLAKRRLSWQKKKEHLVKQKGSGFLPVLLTVISSALSSLFS